MLSILNKGLSSLRGVGAARATAYARMGIVTLDDLLHHYPRSYENRGDVKLLSETMPDVKSAVILTVATAPKSARIRRGMSLLKFRAFDDAASCEITFFNQDYLKDKFPIGSTFRFYGKVEKNGNRFSMTAPAYEPFVEGMPLRDFYPIYPLSAGLTQKQVAQNLSDTLKLCGNLPDPLPEPIRTGHGLCTLSYALTNIHDPESYGALATAKRRLIFDEFFLFALGMAVTHRQAKAHGAPVMTKRDLTRFAEGLPFSLTEAQGRVIGEIVRDMGRDVPMSRIVVGDVGCGKTVCAAAAIYLAAINGYQSALMAPTEILARQHYKDLAPLLGAHGIRCELLVGATTAARKKQIRASLVAESEDGRLDVVIGTHALLSDGVEFARPGLIVTDEQHRFGAAQRSLLSRKAHHSHVLVMSATPIPRSLALALYGDLDISRIDQMPPGRQRVDTFVVDESYRQRLNGFIRKQVQAGGQVYIVCPAVEDREEEGDLDLADISLTGERRRERPPLRAAVSYADELQSLLPDLTVGFVHGKMKSTEKDAIMSRFAMGEVDVLVSTTVIEVGVNVPNACLMIVENADRFGLSQLHQLRGRVGRGTRKSYCVLVSDSQGERAEERLSIMRTTYDGYVIAEKDLAMRGPGDFLAGAGQEAVRQSGGLRFRLADMCDDAGLFADAFADARALVERDRELTDFPLLREAVDSLFSLDAESIN